MCVANLPGISPAKCRVGLLAINGLSTKLLCDSLVLGHLFQRPCRALILHTDTRSLAIITILMEEETGSVCLLMITAGLNRTQWVVKG